MRPDLIEAYEGEIVKLHIYQARDPQLRNIYWLTGGYGEIEFSEPAFAELRGIIHEYDEYENEVFRINPCRDPKRQSFIVGLTIGALLATFVFLILFGVIS